MAKFKVDESDWDPLAGITPEQKASVLAVAAGETNVPFPPSPTPPYMQPPQAPPPEPPRTEQATPPPSNQPQVNWFFVRRRNEYPGNHPDYNVLRQLGIGGILTEIDDPMLQDGLNMDRANGFLAGVWIDPGKYGSPQGAANHLATTLAGARVDTIALDPETGNVAKGFPGSPQWSYSATLAVVIAGTFPGVPIVVTPIPLQDDFNYKAYLEAGQDVWVQCYGSDLTQLFDPVAVVQRVMANGVPVSRIGALISPLQLPTAPPALKAIGVTKISVYTSDHLTPEVVAQAGPFLPLNRFLHSPSTPPKPKPPPRKPPKKKRWPKKRRPTPKRWKLQAILMRLRIGIRRRAR